MRHRASWPSLLVVVAVCHSALAEPDESTKQQARALMTRGRQQRAAGDQRGALQSFTQAHELMNVPTTRLETARSHADVGELVAALQLLRAMPTAANPEQEPAPFARARTEAAELMAQLEPRVPRLSLDVSGSPRPDATVLIVDGEPRPDCAVTCQLDPGPHVVSARAPTARALEQLTLAEGATERLELVFSPDAVAAPVIAPLPPTSRMRATPSIPVTTWVLGGAAVAGLGAGALLGVSAVARRDALKESCAPHCAENELDDVRRTALFANVALGVGVAAGALAVVSFVLREDRREPPPSRGLSVGASPDPWARGARVTVAGAF